MPVSLASTSASTTHGALVPISFQTITAGSSGINFTSIPSNYQDLMVVICPYNSATYTGNGIWMRLNSDSNNLYNLVWIKGDGSSVSSPTNSGTQFTLDNLLSSGIPSTYTINLLNYANTSTYKNCLIRQASDNNGSGTTQFYTGTYRSTSAISQINFVIPGGNGQLAGGTAALYGIRTVGQ